jgi:conjugal transfer ATP-binding protein TraC
MTASPLGPGSRGASRETPTTLRGAPGFDSPLLIDGLPSEVAFGFLGRVLPLTEPSELRLELHRLPTDRAMAILERAAAVVEAEIAGSSRASAGAQAAELERAVDHAGDLARRIAAREEALWEVGVLFVGRHRDPVEAERVRSELERRLTELGFRPRLPRYETAGALQPPDFGAPVDRPAGFYHYLPTSGLAAFFPFVEESVVEPGGILVGLLLDDGSPVLVNRWAHASHSWGLFGTTGSGKSFAAALWALRSRWMTPGLELVILDPLGEFVTFAERLGGAVVPLGARSPSAGRLNPLDPVTTGGDRAEKAGRVGTLVRALFPSLLDEEAAALDTALTRLFENGPRVPTFSDLVGEVVRVPGAPSRLVALLEVFTRGSLRHLDGPSTIAATGNPVVFDLRGVPEEQLPFHLAYLLDAVYGRIRAGGARKLVLVDEAHFLVRHRATAEFLDQTVRHVRHFGSGLLLASQNPEDFLAHEAGRSILRNLRASLLLRLTSVSPATREFFRLTDAEAEWLPRAALPREVGWSEGLFRMGESHLPLAILPTATELELLSEWMGSPVRGRGRGAGRPVLDGRSSPPTACLSPHIPERAR